MIRFCSTHIILDGVIKTAQTDPLNALMIQGLHKIAEEMVFGKTVVKQLFWIIHNDPDKFRYRFFHIIDRIE